MIEDSIYRYEKDVEFERHKGKEDNSTLIILSEHSNILLSAPHSVKQYREGLFKVVGINTYGIGRYIQDVCNCNFIASLGNFYTDPNYDKESFYKKQLDSIFCKSSIKFVIDLHGCKNKEEYVDMDIATNYGKTLCKDEGIIQIIKDVNIKHRNLKISENKYFTSANNNTIASFVSNNYNIPSIELEISNNGRCTNKVDGITNYLVDLVSRIQMKLEN